LPKRNANNAGTIAKLNATKTCVFVNIFLIDITYFSKNLNS